MAHYLHLEGSGRVLTPTRRGRRYGRSMNVALLLAASTISMPQQTPQTFSAKVTVPSTLGYQLSLPEGYEANQTARWPLMLFLHGAGERGTDL